MESYEGTRDNLLSSIQIGDLDEVKRISILLSNSDSCYPDYNLFCISLLHKQIDIARFFLTQNCEVLGDSRRNYRGNSALHLAVLFGDSSMVEMILKKGASHSARNIDGLVPLHLVVYRNPVTSGSSLSIEEFDQDTSNIIDLLIKYGTDIDIVVNSQDKYGYTSLHLAAECGNEKIVPVLFEKKSNFNAKSEAGLSPLHVAVINKSFGIVNLLLKRGAILYSKDRKGRTPLSYSIEQGQMEMTEILLNFKPPVPMKRSKYALKLKNDNNAILTAAKKNDPFIVKYLLNKGVMVNASWRNGITPLHIAVLNGSEDIIQLLLDHGANVTAVAKDGRTPLYIAVEREWLNIIQMLLDYIPKVDSVVSCSALHGYTPLHLAVRKGSMEIVKLLLKKGMQADFKTQSGQSPLHIAVQTNRKEILKLLLESGADINVTDASGRTALQIAVAQGKMEIIEEMCDFYSKQEEKWKEGYPALYIAAHSGREDIVKLLLEKGADLNAKTEIHLAPLYAASEVGHEQIVKLFIENGADVNEIFSNGRSALHCAVEKGFINIVECLLDNGANVNFDIYRDSPLHLAVIVGNMMMVQLLLKKGADVNAKNSSHATPLFLAVQKNRVQIVKYLISNGADVNINDKENTPKSFNYSSDCIHDLRSCRGLRPLVVAVDNGNENLVKILLANGAPADIENEKISPLHLAAANGSLNIVKQLLRFGANINSVCEQNYTPLSHAIASGKTETVVCLLTMGVNISMNSSNSVLYIALSYAEKDKNIVELLLDFGADVRAKNVDNKTPLHCAIAFGNTVEQKGLFKLLLDYGSEINARDKEGNTPLHVAAREGDFVAAEVFLEYEADVNSVNQEGQTALKYVCDAIKDDLILYLYNTNSNICPYAAIAKLIVSIIVIRKFRDRLVNKQNSELVLSEKIKCFYEKCKGELEEMKSREVFKNLSYYSILTNSDSDLAFCIRNKSMVQNLDLSIVQGEFPCYAMMLISRVRNAKERRMLLEPSEEQLNSILRFKFPSLVVHEIFSYLSTVDLKNMGRVFQRPGYYLSKFLNRS